MLIAFIVYFVVVGIFLLVSILAIYHIHRFRTEWDSTKVVTFVYMVFSAGLIAYSLLLMLNTSWEEVIS